MAITITLESTKQAKAAIQMKPEVNFYIFRT
jgi:hypothetical protein